MSWLTATPLHEVATVWPPDADELKSLNIATVEDLLQQIKQQGYDEVSRSSGIPDEHLHDYYDASNVEFSKWYFSRNVHAGLYLALAILIALCFVSLPDVDTGYAGMASGFVQNGDLESKHVSNLENILQAYGSLVKSTDDDSQNLKNLELLVAGGQDISEEEIRLRARNALELLGVYRFKQALSAISDKDSAQWEKNVLDQKVLYDQVVKVLDRGGPNDVRTRKNKQTLLAASARIFDDQMALIIENQTEQFQPLLKQGEEVEKSLKDQRQTLQSLRARITGNEFPLQRKDVERMLERAMTPVREKLDTITKGLDGLTEKVNTSSNFLIQSLSENQALGEKMYALSQVTTKEATDKAEYLQADVTEVKTIVTGLQTNPPSHFEVISEDCGFSDVNYVERRLKRLWDFSSDVSFEVTIAPISEADGSRNITTIPSQSENKDVTALMNDVVALLGSGKISVKDGQRRCRLTFRTST